MKMSLKQISAAVQLDANVCNALDPPTAGVHVGGGIHVTIPSDWATRILAGQDVPGCSYAKPASDGTLVVTDAVQAALLIPANVSALSAPLQTEVVALNTKLASAIVVS